MALLNLINQIGLNIKILRKNKGITQEKLAELIGVSRITIVNIEKGNNSSLLTFLKIIKYFDETEFLKSWNIEAEPIIDDILIY